MKKLLSFSMVLVLTLAIFVGYAGNQVSAQDVDLVSAASISSNPAAIEKAMGEDGRWIICPTTDMHFNSELVIEGTFHDKGDSSNEVYRKVGPYGQDDNHNITERYTVSAPQFTVKSPNTKFQGGYFVGDVYVQANGFTIDDAIIVGNVYYENEEYKNSASVESGGRITGEAKVQSDVDLVAAASITNNPAAIEKAMGEDGTWIICPTTDMQFNSELLIEGTFHDKGDSSNDVYRKVGPYSQDDNYNVTERYTVIAPQFTVKSPNTKFQGGHFVGDVYVQANGFTIDDAVVVGNVYFENEEYKSSFSIAEGGEVTGVTEVK